MAMTRLARYWLVLLASLGILVLDLLGLLRLVVLGFSIPAGLYALGCIVLGGTLVRLRLGKALATLSRRLMGL